MEGETLGLMAVPIFHKRVSGHSCINVNKRSWSAARRALGAGSAAARD
jgi:hypothetical protein